MKNKIGLIWSLRLKAVRFVSAVCTAGLIGITALPVNAALITQSVEFEYLGENRGTSPSMDFRASINRFDPSLGTLRQVDIIYDFDIGLDISISNRTLSAVSTNLGPTSLQIQGPRFFDRFSFNNVVASTAINETLTTPAGTERQFGSINLVLPGRALTSIELDRRFSRTSRPLQIRNIVLRPQGNVSPFVGTDQMVLDFVALTALPLNLPNTGGFLDGVRSSTAFSLAGMVNVTYDFLEAPPVSVDEPNPLVLMGVGVLALGLVRRKKGLISG